MEPLALESVLLIGFLVHLLVSIFCISEYGISDRGEVDSDLMRSTCQEIHFEERIFISNNSLIEKFRFSEFWVYRISSCHFFPVIGITPDE